MMARLLPPFRSNAWKLAFVLLALAPGAAAQGVSRSAGRLLCKGPAGRLPVKPPRGLAATLASPRGLLTVRRPSQGALRHPAPDRGWPAAPSRGLAAKAGRSEAGRAGFKPADMDDSRVLEALEDLRRDAQGLFDGTTLTLRQAWVREAAAGPAVRLEVLMEPAGDQPAEAGRIRLEVLREPGQAWRLHAVAAAAASPVAARWPEPPPTLKVMILCPETRVAVPTGLAMSAEAFLAADLHRNTLAGCPACAGTHRWGKQDAHLQ